MSARARLPRGEGSLLREEILHAADELLIETASSEAVSIRAIATKVGVTAPSIYRHFEDKESLLFAVCERTFGRLAEQMEKAAVGVDDPLAALAAQGQEYVSFGLRHPEHYRFLMMSLHADEQADLVEGKLTGKVVEGSRAFNNLLDSCERVLAEAERRASRRRRAEQAPLPSSLELAVEVWALVHGVVALRISFPTMPWPPASAQVTAYCEGLRARFQL